MGRGGVRYGRILTTLITVNVGAVVAVSFLHEAGHAVIGRALHCSVSVDLLATFTQLSCATPPADAVLAASAFLFVVPVSGIFLAHPHYAHRSAGLVLAGVAVLAAAQDIGGLLTAPGITPVPGLLGGVVALYGDERLVRGMIAVQESRQDAV